MVDRLGRKRGPQVLLMSRLSALLPLLAPLGSGFFGLTMSLDGGFEEVEEFFFSRAFSTSRRSTWATKSVIRA